MYRIDIKYDRIRKKCARSDCRNTDGIPDTENAEEKFFTLDRLEKSLSAHRDTGMEELLKSVSADLHTFMGGADQFDDITMLGFRYLGTI